MPKKQKEGVRILVCGGRDFNDEGWLNRFLGWYHFEYNIIEIIHGNARGADTLASKWACKMRIKETAVDADWDKYGKKAGWIRNTEMAALTPDAVIPFPGGRGTAMMIKIAETRGIPVCRPD